MDVVMVVAVAEVTCVLAGACGCLFCTVKNRINKNEKKKRRSNIGNSSDGAPVHSMRATVKSMM